MPKRVSKDRYKYQEAKCVKELCEREHVVSDYSIKDEKVCKTGSIEREDMRKNVRTNQTLL